MFAYSANRNLCLKRIDACSSRELAHDGTHDSGNPKATGRSTALQPRYTNWYYYFSGQFKDADN